MTDTDYLNGISLRSVHMHSCSHERGPGDPSGQPEVETQGQLQATSSDDGQLGYLVSLTYKILDSDSKDPMATGEVVYYAAYELAEDLKLSDDQVQQFGLEGVLFQVHPFLREHMATMCQRSGLVGYPLPILLHEPVKGSTDDVHVDGM